MWRRFPGDTRAKKYLPSANAGAGLKPAPYANLNLAIPSEAKPVLQPPFIKLRKKNPANGPVSQIKRAGFF
jgi:hypothetical protein